MKLDASTIIAFITDRVNHYIPRNSVCWRFTPAGSGISYLHPRKGWKIVSLRRMGMRL